jgi:hypothetical protein
MMIALTPASKLVEVGLGDLVRDQKDAGRDEDADEHVPHPGVVVDAERSARERVAVERSLVDEHKQERKHDAEHPNADPHPQVRAHIARRVRVRLGIGPWLDLAHRRQKAGHRRPRQTGGDAARTAVGRLSASGIAADLLDVCDDTARGRSRVRPCVRWGLRWLKARVAR